MKSACYITVIGNPSPHLCLAFSARAGPIGIQIVGECDDYGVLQMAYAFEQARNLEKRKPIALG